MTEIWIIRYIDPEFIHHYWNDDKPGYTTDINSATIFRDWVVIEQIQKSLIATKPEVIPVVVVPKI